VDPPGISLQHGESFRSSWWKTIMPSNLFKNAGLNIRFDSSRTANGSTRRLRSCFSATAGLARRNCAAGCAIWNSIRAPPTTHGVRLGKMTVTLENLPVRLNLWDFGGQHICHGSHFMAKLSFPYCGRRILNGRAAKEEGVTLRHRPLSY
jgi:hypothetical protein